MTYFIDHGKQRIHQKLYAGDRCEFTDTPAEKREFTEVVSYIEWLESEKQYVRCPHCKSLQILLD